MVTPISNARISDPHQVSKSPTDKAAPKPRHQAQPPQTPKSGAVSPDQVTLKTAGQVDHDNDGK
jgi:hypothetical protein